MIWSTGPKLSVTPEQGSFELVLMNESEFPTRKAKHIN
jgi:hypothetical protein